MKLAAVIAILLSGCAAISVPKSPAPAVSDASFRADVDIAEEAAVRIVPNLMSRRDALPMVIRMHAETHDLPLPVKFHWTLGNGREWEGPEPPVQFYSVGRYDVVLTVTDSAGRVRKASMNVDAESHGCGF